MLSPKERARRRFWLGVVALISSVAIYPLLYWLISPPPADVTKVRAAFGAWAVGWFALVWGISALWPRVRRSVAAMAAFVDDPRSAAATGSMTEVSAQLGKLIAEAQDKVRRDWDSTQRPRFVVVVDDLERCQPPKAVDVCEVAAQLLNHRDVITILVGDLRVIAASAELKYRDAVDQFGKGSDFAADGFGRFFLQKVVQFELELPPIPPERLRQLARSPGAGSDRADYRMPKPVNRPLGATGKLWVVIFFICIGILKLIGANSVGLSALIATLAIAFGVTIIRFARRPRSRKLRILRDKVAEAINIVLTEVIASVDPSVTSEDIEAEAMKRLAEVEGAYKEEKYWKDAKDLVSAEKVRPRLQLSAVADEKTRADAVGAILDLLPPIPRTTKRLLNRLYFLLVVAYNRNLITLKKVSPEQLGKWAVLLDRWPEAARAINKNPQLVQVLEDKAEQQDDFTTLCSEYTPPLASDLGPLRDFFQANPKLAPAAYNLVYLDADVKPPAPSSALTTEPEASPEATETPADTAVPAAAPNGRREKNPMTR